MAASSTPLSTPPSSDTIIKQNLQPKSLPQYRPAKELPFELARHIQTYYEESLFTQAFSYLISITSNSILGSNANAPVRIPPAAHLSVAATLAIHPSVTTRTTSRDKWDQANAAFQLLRLVLVTVGPVNAKLSDAFKFKKYESRSSRTSRSYDDHGLDDYDPDKVNTRYAGSNSLWSRAEDFWHIVGWSLSCSCLPDMYASRWQHWQLWLEFMLDVLERDWEVHYARQTCEESLMWQYIELASGGYGRQRRMMRAIFADGSTRSLNEFRAVFHHELKPASDGKGMKKREVDVNVDKDVFGDYLEQSESDSDTSSLDRTGTQPKKRTRTRTTARTSSRTSSRASAHSSKSDNSPDRDSSHTTTTLGPPASLRLRLRLLHLLSHVAGNASLHATSPTTFPDLDELYTLFVEWISPLPLPILTQVISPSTPGDVLSVDAHTTLCERILQHILESAAPSVRFESFLTKQKLVEQYLPFAAGGDSAEAQAKVSLLLEALLRRCVGMLLKDEDKSDVKEVLERGVKHREEIAFEARGKKGKGRGAGVKEEREREAWKGLKESGKRMRACVELL